MEKKVKKLIKVTLEYEDGTLRVLNKRCEEWRADMDSALFLQSSHGWSMGVYPWRVIKPRKLTPTKKDGFVYKESEPPTATIKFS
jgi:hypothetical protein